METRITLVFEPKEDFAARLGLCRICAAVSPMQSFDCLRVVVTTGVLGLSCFLDDDSAEVSEIMGASLARLT